VGDQPSDDALWQLVEGGHFIATAPNRGHQRIVGDGTELRSREIRHAQHLALLGIAATREPVANGTVLPPRDFNQGRILPRFGARRDLTPAPLLPVMIGRGPFSPLAASLAGEEEKQGREERSGVHVARA